MIFCPACNAENPDGTKICVKCGTELPKVAASAAPAPAANRKPAAKTAESEKSFGVKDMGRDIVDILWLVAILLLLIVGFAGEITHWTFTLTTTDEAKLVPTPILAHPHPRARHHYHHHPSVSRPVRSASIEKMNPILETGNPDSLYAEGKKQYDDKKYHDSYETLKKALEIDPTYAKAYFGMGYLYARFDMNDAAVRMYQMALRFDSQFADPINNLALMYEKAGNFDDALALLQQAVAINGNNSDYELNLGDVYLDKDQPDQALEAFQKASNLSPSDANVYNEMALTYERLGQKQDAEDTWQKVLQYSKKVDILKQAKSHLDYLQAQS